MVSEKLVSLVLMMLQKVHLGHLRIRDGWRLSIPRNCHCEKLAALRQV